MLACYYGCNMLTIGILVSSDLGSQGIRSDTSGNQIRDLFSGHGFVVLRYEVVPDEQLVLEERMRTWSDVDALDLIVTSGGTGLTNRDVTPEATKAVIQWQIPGMAEAMRTQTLQHTPMAMISRSIVGVRGHTLIINLPGNPNAVRECIAVVLPVIPHAIELLQDSPPPHNLI